MIRIARTAVLGMALAVAPAWAQLYKWVDERGVTHYGEKPPANKGAPVNLRDATGGPKQEEPATSKSRTPRRQETDLQRQEREFQQRQQTRDRQAADDARRKEDARPSERDRQRECRAATEDLATMQRNPTIYTYAQQGQARERIARSCN